MEAVSRHGRHWPKAQDPEPPSDDRAERQPRWISVVRDIITGLMVIALGLGVLYVLRVESNQNRTEDRLRELEAATAVRVQQRNQQLQELEALIRETNRQSVCDLLDGFPAGGFLDPKRTEYGCGPGIPLSELSPEQRQELQSYRQGPLTTGNEPDPLNYYAEPDPRYAEPSASADAPEPSQAPAAPPGSPAPSPSPSVPPLVDLGPITDPLCDALGICL